jgi:hypothetical protein
MTGHDGLKYARAHAGIGEITRARQKILSGLPREICGMKTSNFNWPDQ